MKAVITAGGFATRLRPLTVATNKHLLPVYDRPMIQRNVELVVESGVTHIMVLLNHIHAQPVMELLEDGKKLGAHIVYGYQREPISVGHHLDIAKHFVGDDLFLLYLGDNFYRSALDISNIEIRGVPHMWVMPLNGEDDFRKYAEVFLESNGSDVSRIVEKPTEQKTGLVQTGAWVFTPEVFARTKRLREEVVGEVQVRTIVADYIREKKMRATTLPRGSFLDLGTVEALYRANTIVHTDSLSRK